MEIYPRMVFVLYDLPPGELRDAAAFLALSAIWKKIQDTDTIPISRRKAIVVDEGWSLVEINPRTGRPYFPLAVEYVPEIARTGRHYNAAFVVATQLVSDLMGRGGSLRAGQDNHRELLHEDRPEAGSGSVAGPQGGVQPQRW